MGCGAVVGSQKTSPEQPQEPETPFEGRICTQNGTAQPAFRRSDRVDVWGDLNAVIGPSARRHLLDVYDICEDSPLGVGPRGEVRKATHRFTGDIVAVKSIARVRLRRRNSLDCCKAGHRSEELAMWEDVRHDRLIDMFEIFEHTQWIYIVFEYCSGGSLFARLRIDRSYEEMQVWRMIRQVLSAVKYLHHHHICHRDIHPSHILLQDVAETITDGFLKLCGLGLATRQLPGERLHDPVGQATYASPEAYIGGDHGYDGFSADVWSVGILVHLLHWGYPPFDSHSAEETAEVAKRGIDELPANFAGKTVSILSRNLLEDMLSTTPDDRPSPDSVHAILRSRIEEDSPRPSQAVEILHDEPHEKPSKGRRRSSDSLSSAQVALHAGKMFMKAAWG